MSGYTKILCALLVVLVASHGASAASMEQGSMLNAVLPYALNLGAISDCIKAYMPEAKKLSEEVTGLVDFVRQQVDLFAKELKNCSSTHPDIIGSVKCQAEVAIRYARTAENVYQHVRKLTQEGKEVAAKVVQCVKAGGPAPTNPPQLQPEPTKAF